MTYLELRMSGTHKLWMKDVVKIYCIWSIDEDHISIKLFLCTLDSNCKIIMHLQISFIVFDSFWFGLGFFFNYLCDWGKKG